MRVAELLARCSSFLYDSFISSFTCSKQKNQISTERDCAVLLCNNSHLTTRRSLSPTMHRCHWWQSCSTPIAPMMGLSNESAQTHYAPLPPSLHHSLHSSPPPHPTARYGAPTHVVCLPYPVVHQSTLSCSYTHHYHDLSPCVSTRIESATSPQWPARCVRRGDSRCCPVE